MFKVIRLAAAGVLASTAAIAGSVAYVAPVVPEVIEEEGSMGGSGLWLIPLIAIALILLATSSDDPEIYGG